MVTFLAGGTGTPKLLDGATRVAPRRDCGRRQHGRRYRTRRPPRLPPRRRHRAVRGWRRPRPRDVVGIADDTTTTHEELRRLATQVGLGTPPYLDDKAQTAGREIARWRRFSGVGEFMEIGDRDRAVHLTRTSLLDEGHTLTEAIRTLADAFDLDVDLLPMSDDPVATLIHTEAGETIHFQEYWVARRADPRRRGRGVPRGGRRGADRRRRPRRPRRARRRDRPLQPRDEHRPDARDPGRRGGAVRDPVVAVSPFIGDEVFSGRPADLMAGVGRDPRPRASPTRTRSRTRSSSTTTIRPTSQTVTSSAPIPGSTTRTTPSASLGCATARWRRWKERRRKRTRRWRGDGERRRVPPRSSSRPASAARPTPTGRERRPPRRRRDSRRDRGRPGQSGRRARPRRPRSLGVPPRGPARVDRSRTRPALRPPSVPASSTSEARPSSPFARRRRSAPSDAVCEVNAHCRQSELRAVGCGESLLRDIDRLAEYVAAVAETGATTSVKVRAEVPGVDLVAVTDAVADAGADWLHVDAMDSEDRRRTDRRSGDRRDRFSPRRSHRDR